MTKKEAELIFKRDILPGVIKEYEKNGRKDMPARSEAWNNWTDSLCKDGQITKWQFNNWTCPKFC